MNLPDSPNPIDPIDPIDPACRAAREELLARPSPPAQFHCESCRAWHARAEAQGRAIASLVRAGGEGELAQLDGRVVAELNAGRRQERAAGVLASLEHVPAPDLLAGRVADSLARPGHRAPVELDDRVAFELAAGSSLRVARQVSALHRLTPPAELEDRVRAALARAGRSQPLPVRRWIAVAATLVVLFGMASWVRNGTREPAPDWGFRVVHVDSAAGLDPLALSLLPLPRVPQ